MDLEINVDLSNDEFVFFKDVTLSYIYVYNKEFIRYVRDPVDDKHKNTVYNIKVFPKAHMLITERPRQNV